jgi:plastocyanin
VLCAAALVAGFALSPARAAETTTMTVDIAKFAFVPREITIEPGTRVRWTNHDEIPHTVTSQGGKKLLASPGLDFGDQYEFVFASEGDFAYLCTVHPMMTGIVHVRKSAAKAP